MVSDIVLSLFIYAICGFFIFQGRMLSGGSEIFPRIIILLLLAVNTLNILKTLKNKPKYSYSHIARVLIIFGISIIYVVLMDIIGFYTTSFIFIISVMYLLGIKKKLYFFIIPISVVLFVYVVFNMIFMIPIPTGFII